MNKCENFSEKLPEAISNAEIKQALSKMILSHSGWRKIFSASGNEEDRRKDVSSGDSGLTCIAVLAFIQFLKKQYPSLKKILVGRDARPTGSILEKVVLKTLLTSELEILPLGISAAPEIMSCAKEEKAAFIYISASHNPIAHNGFKFGTDSGGVIGAEDSSTLISIFKNLCSNPLIGKEAVKVLLKCEKSAGLKSLYEKTKSLKDSALKYYFSFSKEVITASKKEDFQNEFFGSCRDASIQAEKKGKPFCILCDFNGSARASSIDRSFFQMAGIKLIGINEDAGDIKHGIIPEGANLRFCADEIERLRKSGKTPSEKNVFLGYMPDCDGDRGNIVFFNEETGKAEELCAQEVFALAVVSELAYMRYLGLNDKPFAVAANGATSLRIEEIAKYFGAEVFRAEVGEANVVNLAEKLRNKGFQTRILGEGSNGGNITFPASVRDPLNTVFAVLKLLLLRGNKNKKGLFQIWLEVSGQEEKFTEDFSLNEIIKTLPEYQTTPVSEQRALLKILTDNHADLKREYQKIFLREWEKRKQSLEEKYGIISYKVFSTKGVIQNENSDDFGIFGSGGLKIQFYNTDDLPVAFIWMRGSGTEPVFRIMADIKGISVEAETELVLWQAEMVKNAGAVLNR